MRKKNLEKRLKRLQDKLNDITARVDASSDANEVRALTVQAEEIREDIEDINDELAEFAEEETRNAAPVAVETQIPANAQRVGGTATAEQRAQNDDMEYRQAFMAFVQKGTPIPAELRAGTAINTEDTGAAIPMTIMNMVINTVRKRYGNLYSKVRKMSVPGGVKIPIGALEASFKWINESTVSPRQRTDKLGAIVFEYNTAEIRIAQTFLSSILTLSAFEAEITKIIAVAYLKAMDEGIMVGSGDGCMLGILNDPRVTNAITLTEAQINNWTAWRKNFFAKLPLGYRSGEFVFAASTVDAHLETMADSNNNPIFRQATGLEVGDGDAAEPRGRFFGRELAMVEPDIITDFDTAQAGDVIGLFWQPNEYAINENFGFTMRRYFDEETNEWIDKALVVVDGKVLNPTGFYKIIKG
jgi:HK97 family phage major capsid protein